MLNKFHYASDIPQSVRDRLIDREQLCEEAIADTSPLEWLREIDRRGRTLYVLKKCGLTRLRLAAFTEAEVNSLPDIDFHSRVFGQDVDEQTRKEKAEMEARITEWCNRLEALYAQVSEWAPDNWTIHPGQILQLHEALMQRYNIAPRPLPTLTLLQGRLRVSFVPSALWIVGADGRVNVTTNKAQYPLVDKRQNPTCSSVWILMAGTRPDQSLPFQRHTLITLLQGAL